MKEFRGVPVIRFVEVMAMLFVCVCFTWACGDDDGGGTASSQTTGDPSDSGESDTGKDPGRDVDTGSGAQQGGVTMTNDELAASLCQKWEECYSAQYPFSDDLEMCVFVVKRDVLGSNCDSFDGEKAYACNDELSQMSCGTFNPNVPAQGLPSVCFELCGEGDTGWIDTDVPADTDAPEDTGAGHGEDVVFSCDRSDDAEAPHCEEFFGSTWESAPDLPALCGDAERYSTEPCPREGCFGICEIAQAGTRMVYYSEVDPLSACAGFSWTGC